MYNIECVLLEPVGCLAEFAPEPFHEMAVRLFGRKGKASKSGSRSYWHLLNLMEAAGRPLSAAETSLLEAAEIDAVNGATVFEDVQPALAELREMGVQLHIASSLSGAAISRFIEAHRLSAFFAGVSHRDNSGGIKAAPLLRASGSSELTIFLTDTATGLETARAAAVHSVLMMNDPDEAKRLAMQNPAGGIVSLHELPDFVRLVRLQSTRA